jgi:hypothetical protein
LLSVVGDPQLAKQPSLKMETGTEIKDQRILFMVPGVEGLAWVMEPLAKQLQRPVVCLQVPLDAKDHSVTQLTGILYQASSFFSNLLSELI